MTNFQTHFIVRIRRKFVIKLTLKIPTYVNSVATLPCELSVSYYECVIQPQGRLIEYLMYNLQDTTVTLDNN